MVGVGPVHDFIQCGGRARRANFETRLGRDRRFAVVGADLLADVAAEDPVAHAWLQVGRNVAAMLDGEVRNAARGVHPVGVGEGVRGTGVEAAGAGAAVVGLRRVWGEVEGGKYLAEEKAGAEVLVQDERVLADPADSGGGGEFALDDGEVSTQIFASKAR